MDAVDILMQNVDKTLLPPLHQKRVLAFVNHFLISSCGFLNDFAVQCETKFIELERKLQKVEAALTIIEAKLASIPDMETKLKMKEQPDKTVRQDNDSVETTRTIVDEKDKDIKVSEHTLYKKFFKMLHVGVPSHAIKIKMQIEGLDPNLLDNSDLMIPFDGSEVLSKES